MGKLAKLAALFLLLFLTASCGPAPTPHPEPLPTAGPEAATYLALFPAVGARGDCPQVARPKLGLAAAGIWQQPDAAQQLCLDRDAPAQDWGPRPRPGWLGLNSFPMLWGITQAEQDRLAAVLEGERYQGVVLAMNECDRPEWSGCGSQFCQYRPESQAYDCSIRLSVRCHVPCVT
ncbi:MAG: hypothetical protein L0322_28175 [Chloroflexi bacterium]|nr:hypothetical protein [Chloroflexota bacterium]MCI0581113.1 hypothetical protein [Chloroflexota bacterium]MCI0648709.1 hypothetical protein [Chloroflexota bacterium]